MKTQAGAAHHFPHETRTEWELVCINRMTRTINAAVSPLPRGDDGDDQCNQAAESRLVEQGSKTAMMTRWKPQA